MRNFPVRDFSKRLLIVSSEKVSFSIKKIILRNLFRDLQKNLKVNLSNLNLGN